MLTLEIEKRLHLEYIRIFKGGVDICKGNIQNQFMYVFVVSCDMKKKQYFWLEIESVIAKTNLCLVPSKNSFVLSCYNGLLFP